MNNHTEAKNLIEQHSDHQVSVMFLPQDMFDQGAKAQWIGQETRQSLRDVIELIIAESGKNSGYRVLVHLGEKDEFLEQSDIDKLVDYVIASGSKDIE